MTSAKSCHPPIPIASSESVNFLYRGGRMTIQCDGVAVEYIQDVGKCSGIARKMTRICEELSISLNFVIQILSHFLIDDR